MTMRQFIRENRAELDRQINTILTRYDAKNSATPRPTPSRNDEERRQWVLNDEGLYHMARAAGVRV